MKHPLRSAEYLLPPGPAITLPPLADGRCRPLAHRLPGPRPAGAAMTLLIVGLVLFLGIHSVSIAAPAWRDGMAARLGEKPWKGLYALVSIAGFVLLVYGYGLARQQPVVLYTPPTWTRHLTLLLMVPVFPLLLAAYLPGRIKAATKHPMLAATKLWAFSH